MALRSIVLFIGLLWVTVLPAHAEFYRYRDLNGAVRYTDNLAEVPPDQRPKVTAYQGAQGDAVKAGKTPAGDDGAGAQPPPAEQEGQEGYEALRQHHEALKLEYEAIEKERRELEKIFGQKMREPELAPYRQRLEALNARTRAYHEKQAVYEMELKAYNTQRPAASKAGGGQ